MEVLDLLLTKKTMSIEGLSCEIEKIYSLQNQYSNTRGAVLHLAKEIFTKDATRKKYEPIVCISGDSVKIKEEFLDCYNREENFKVLVDDLIRYNLSFTLKNFPQTSKDSLILYKSYERKEIHRLTNYDYVNGAIQPGYPLSKDADEQLIFITLDDSTSFTSYDNQLNKDSTLTWFSTNRRKLKKDSDPNKEGKIAMNQYDKIRILIRRRNSENFYYVGDVAQVLEATQTVNENNDNIVKYLFSLKKEIPTELKGLSQITCKLYS